MEVAAAALRDDEQAEVEELLDALAATGLAESSGRLIGPSRDGGCVVPTVVGLAIHLLGPFRILHDGQEIEIGSRDRASEILQYLACGPVNGVHKDELADRFWPDAGERAGKRSLHQAIYTLRRTLATHGAADELRFEGDRYSFGGPDRWRDVDRLDDPLLFWRLQLELPKPPQRRKKVPPAPRPRRHPPNASRQPAPKSHHLERAKRPRNPM